MAGWEVEGFIDRLTRRDDKTSERLVLEAISHLRAFSRDCDALREANQELRADNEQMLALLQELIDIEGPCPGTNGWATKVRAAIAKAKEGTA